MIRRNEPSAKTVEEFIALVPEHMREQTRAELLGNPNAWHPRKPQTQTTFLERTADRED